MRTIAWLGLAVALLNPVFSIPLNVPRSKRELSITTQTIFQFPPDTCNLENIAIRSNGNLLITQLSFTNHTTANLYEINPFSPTPTASLILNIPNLTGLLGITEIKPDLFAFIAGNISPTASFTNLSVYTISLTTPPYTPHLLTTFPDALCLNGITSLDDQSSTSPLPSNILLSDCTLGLIYRLDTTTGSYTRIPSDPHTMLPPPSAPLPIGINGLKYRPSTAELFYVNTYNPLLAKVELHVTSSSISVHKTPTSDSSSASDFTVLATGGLHDDFALSPDGRFAYIAEHARNAVVRVDLATGEQRVVMGGKGGAGSGEEMMVKGATSLAFGRVGMEGVLFVVTTEGRVIRAEIGEG